MVITLGALCLSSNDVMANRKVLRPVLAYLYRTSRHVKFGLNQSGLPKLALWTVVGQL